MTWERKEKEGPLARLDDQGLLDLREPLEVQEILATQVSFGFWVLNVGSIICSNTTLLEYSL